MAIRAGNEGGGVATPLRALERRKHQNPSSVIVLEALSRILPDHTYVTELRIEGDKLRMIGITLEELRALPNRLCVAGGPEKVEALSAALRGGYITHLVTDAAAAASLLEVAD